MLVAEGARGPNEVAILEQERTGKGSPSRGERRVMSTVFPGESTEYRTARERLLEQEVELRRVMEAVAAARRDLPRGGAIPCLLSVRSGSQGLAGGGWEASSGRWRRSCGRGTGVRGVAGWS